MTLKKIVLHGSLADHIPNGEFECDFDRVTHAVSAIEANYPGFQDKIRKMELHVVIGKLEDENSFDEDQVATWTVNADEIHIMPAMSGAGGGKGLKAILGIVLIGVAFVVSGGMAGIFAGGLASTVAVGGISLGITGTQLLLMGGSLLATALTKTPEIPEPPERQTSTFYQGPINTQSEGSVLPYTAGRAIVGGVVISADLYANLRNV